MTPEFQHILVIAAVTFSTIAVLGLSFLLAYRQKRELDNYTPQSFHAPKKRGRKATKLETKERNYRDDVAFKWSRLYSAFGRLVAIAIYGFVIPSVALFGFVWFYKDLGLGGAPLERVGEAPQYLATPTFGDTLAFLLTEFTKGAASDIAEVFDWQVTTISHNVHNLVVDLVVLAYRFVLDAFALSILFLVARIGWIATHLTEQEREELYNMSMKADLEKA